MAASQFAGASAHKLRLLFPERPDRPDAADRQRAQFLRKLKIAKAQQGLLTGIEIIVDFLPHQTLPCVSMPGQKNKRIDIFFCPDKQASVRILLFLYPALGKPQPSYGSCVW